MEHHYAVAIKLSFGYLAATDVIRAAAICKKWLEIVMWMCAERENGVLGKRLTEEVIADRDLLVLWYRFKIGKESGYMNNFLHIWYGLAVVSLDCYIVHFLRRFARYHPAFITDILRVKGMHSSARRLWKFDVCYVSEYLVMFNKEFRHVHGISQPRPTIKYPAYWSVTICKFDYMRLIPLRDLVYKNIMTRIAIQGNKSDLSDIAEWIEMPEDELDAKTAELYTILAAH